MKNIEFVPKAFEEYRQWIGTAAVLYRVSFKPTDRKYRSHAVLPVQFIIHPYLVKDLLYHFKKLNLLKHQYYGRNHFPDRRES